MPRVRDRDREQHIALARTKARKAGANLDASTRNAGIDYDRAAKVQRKKDRRTRRLDDLLTEPYVESFLQALMDLEHARTKVSELLDTLTFRERHIVELRAIDGWDASEIGRVFRVTRARVYAIYNRAMKKLGDQAKLLEQAKKPS